MRIVVHLVHMVVFRPSNLHILVDCLLRALNPWQLHQIAPGNEANQEIPSWLATLHINWVTEKATYYPIHLGEENEFQILYRVKFCVVQGYY